MLLRHLNYSKQHFGEALGLKLMKKHFVWYSKWAATNKKEFRSEIMKLNSFSKSIETIEKFFCMGESEVKVFPWWQTSLVH